MRSREKSLFDREQELAFARHALTEVESGEGRTLLIEGPAGIGKSALLAAIAEAGRARNFEVLLGRAGQYEGDLAWGIVADLFGPLLGALAADERQQLLTGAASLAAPMFGFASGASPSPNSLSASLHGLYWLTVGIADKYGKLLLTIDDVHWADELSLRWLGRLATRIEELPILIVATIRTNEPDAGAAADRMNTIAPPAQTLHLRALTDEGSHALAAQLFGCEPAREFTKACHRATGGNPLLLRELILAMREEGAEPTIDAARRVPDVDPRSVARSVRARLSRLSPAAGLLATGAAVLQSRPRVNEAVELMELQPDEAQDAADELIAAGIIEEGLELVFTHPIVRNAVYEDLSPHRRSSLELRAARVRARRGTAAEQVATHLLAVEPAGDSWVVEQLRNAAEDASKKGAPDAAVSYLARALEERTPEADPAPLFDQLALAQFGAGQVPESFDSFEQALELSRSPEERVEIGSHYARRQAILQTGRGAEIMESLHAGLPPDTQLAAGVEAELLGMAIVHTSRFPAARDRLRQLRSTDQVQNPILLAAMAAAAGASGEPIDVVAALAGRAIAGGVRDCARLGIFTPVAYAGVALSVAERYEAAAALWEQVIDEAGKAGAPVVYAIGSCYRAELNLRRGRVVEAEADARTAVRLFGEGGVEHIESIAYLAQALVERDQPAEALELLDATALPERPVLWGHYLSLFSHGRAMIADGQFEAGLADLGLCADPSALCFGGPVLPWRSAAAIGHHGLGELDAARSLVAEELHRAQKSKAPRAIGIARIVQGEIAEKENAVPMLRRAEETLDGTEAELERARATVALGAALRRAGQRREARRVLRKGLIGAQACGGLRLGRLAKEELAAAGAKPRRDELRGRDALTASELRVVSLAVEGKTNARIAQQLFVTRRTVETHLTHAYQKLDIRSRRELAGSIKADPRQGSD